MWVLGAVPEPTWKADEGRTWPGDFEEMAGKDPSPLRQSWKLFWHRGQQKKAEHVQEELQQGKKCIGFQFIEAGLEFFSMYGERTVTGNSEEEGDRNDQGHGRARI